MTYFFVAFFLGFVPMGFLAIVNAVRLSRDKDLLNKTIAVATAITLIGFLSLAVAPAAWVDGTVGSARLVPQVIGVAGSAVLHSMHRGPALSRLMSTEEYESVWWGKVLPLVLYALIQAVIMTGIIYARGLQ